MTAEPRARWQAPPLSGEVHDGRGAQRGADHSARAFRRPLLRVVRHGNRKGGERQEPAEMAEPVQLSRRVHQSSGNRVGPASGARDASRRRFCRQLQPDFAPTLSATLGRSVTLLTTPPEHAQLEEYWPDMEELANRDVVTDEAMPPGTFFDLAILHVLTTGTLDRLRELNPHSRFEPRRFGPISSSTPAAREGFVENDWIGKTIAIGPEVRIRSDRALSALRHDHARSGRSAQGSGDSQDRGAAQRSPRRRLCLGRSHRDDSHR